MKCKKPVVMLLLLLGFLLKPAFANELPDFTSLIKENAPVVVQIESKSSTSVNTQRRGYDPMNPDDLLRYFFEGPGGFPRIEPRARPRQSQGSGFFIDESGYIITNAHVVKGGDEITVRTKDQKEYQAELIGMDERTDIALLKIDVKKTPAAKIGDSDAVEVGNWVLAIGNPFGFDHTATKGIVSATSRSLPDGAYVPFIQTDAAVNPGNSGGPLFNLQGQVIGVNSQIYSNTGSFNGLAFAIPINTAMNIANQLRDAGYVSRGWLGVAIQSVNQDLASSFGLDKPKGALVSDVVKDSPAQEAGIQPGDIILTFNEQSIEKSSDLPPLVGDVAAGTTVEVELMRQGKAQKLRVDIGELEEERDNAPLQSSKETNEGFQVTELSDADKANLSLTHGVLVTHVAPESRAATAGFFVNDVILQINDKRIDSIKAFKSAIGELKADKPAAVLVNRNGRTLFIPL
ncbi:DegQ family serine endoprotease [Ostreibacterium oceani]|uniref:Probable periplasmic serine endoprotease DegP-like n=1 Tax=Ostreibacterium oceani TaxID=2654998 RepID=A0A6N7ES21_9GAMM|nr:DegQ family serine endoprotease [Ostreibacterium oceani]MPV85292.1 Do family serine endopeptidase [Ostreibacterium oceani]